MNDQKQQLIDKIKGAKNVLVTVSTNPSVDQLSAAIGLTLILNKLDKHATAVYSGQTPSTIEFLRPETTLEKNTDSLRDFIISLDKAKADKLRYKVEEKVVKIFITPYRTSLTPNDLEFSQGDFNVDVVIALGVHYQQDLDSAITAHGRILHDAVVTTVNNTPDGDLGSINWQDGTASSLSEQIAALAVELGESLFDDQIATALLTGVVSETGRFRNEKTTPRTMSIAASLMAAGANQQLVASELEVIPEPAAHKPQETETNIQPTAAAPEVAEAQEPAKPNDGTLEIEHDETAQPEEPAELPSPEPVIPLPEPVVEDAGLPEIDDVKTNGDGIKDDELGVAQDEQDEKDEPKSKFHEPNVPKFVTEPPSMGGMLTANSRPEELEPSVDPLSAKSYDNTPLLDRSDNPQYGDNRQAPDLSVLTHSEDSAPVEPSLASLLDSSAVSSTSSSVDSLPAAEIASMPAVPVPNDVANRDPQTYDHETLDQIEAEVHGSEPVLPNMIDMPEGDVDSARQAVEDAIKALPDAGDNGPILALNAQPFGEDLHEPDTPPAPDALAGVVDPAFGTYDQSQSPLTPAPPSFQPLPDPAPAQFAQPAQPDPFANLIPPQPQALAVDQQFMTPLPPSMTLPQPDSMSPTASPNVDPSAPPPVPPPMMPPGFGNLGQ